MPQKINEEVVIVVNDEHGEPDVIVRKSATNGGKVQLFHLKPLGFSDVETFLRKLAGEEVKK